MHINVGKAIVILGAGRLQIPYFVLAEQYGLKVVLIDRNPNSIGRPLADYFLEADCRDFDRILPFILQIHGSETIVGVHCGSDFGLNTLARLCERLNIEYTNLRNVDTALRKNKSKVYLEQHGILVPEGMAFTKPVEAMKYYHELGTRAIIKPVTSSGNQGVSDTGDRDFMSAYKMAAEYCPEVIVEKYLDGRHIDASGFLINSQFYPLGTAERMKLPSHVTIKAIAPAPIGYELEVEVFKTLGKSAKALGIKNGPVKGDFILSGNDIYVLEIGPRFHGDIYSAHLSDIFLSQSVIELLFRFFSFGVPPKYAYTNNKSGVLNIYAEPGYVSEITGIEHVLSMQGIKNIILLKKNGFTIRDNRDNRSIIGFIIAQSKNYLQIDNILDEARKRIHFKYN